MNKIGKVGVYNNQDGKGIILIKGSSEKVEFDLSSWFIDDVPEFGMMVQIDGDGKILKFEEKVEDFLSQESSEIKEEVSFSTLRNLLYNEFKDNSSFVVKSDKSDSFLFRNEKEDGYVHLKKDASGFTVEFFKFELRKELIKELKKYEISVKSDSEIILEPKLKKVEVKATTSLGDNNPSEKINTANKALSGTAIVLIIGLLVMGYFGYNFLTKPSSTVVKNIAAQYNIGYNNKGTAGIEIIDNYSEKGQTIYVLKIGRSLCEMPMVKTDKGWVSTGINCRG